MAAHLYASNSLWHLGYPDQALQHAALALEAARAQEIPAGLARALWFGATASLLRGNAEAVRVMMAELEALCARHQLALW